MERAQAHPLPTQDPISGGPLVITELQGLESGITLRGLFEIPRFAKLSLEQTRFLETFLRCRGMLNSVEKELGISYPTARARLDAVLRVLDLANGRDDLPPAPETPETPAVPVSTAAPVPPGEVGSEAPAPPESASTPKLEDKESGWGSEEDSETVAPEPKRTPMEILDAIERGEITAEEAKREVGQEK